jgi:hypothetical protein
MANRDIVGFAQGIESQGDGLLPERVVWRDRLFAVGRVKGKKGHVFSQKTEVRNQKSEKDVIMIIYPLSSVICLLMA